MQLLSIAEGAAQIAKVLGDVSQEPSQAELLRCELAAIQTSPRWLLVSRCLSKLSPLYTVESEALLSLLMRMASLGDCTAGPRGIVSMAPLRAVAVTANDYLLLGTCPTLQLREMLSPLEVSAGVLRGLRCTSEEEHSLLKERLTAHNGRLVSIERWTGLAEVPPAGEEWLALLQERLESASIHDAPTPWESPQQYIPSAEYTQQKRWRWVKQEPTIPTLFRARQSWGGYSYAWGTPGRLFSLNHDEALRTMFSIERSVAPLVIKIEEGASIELHLECLLPRAEYRYLLGAARGASEGGWPSIIRLEPSLWSGVRTLLEERLGLFS